MVLRPPSALRDYQLRAIDRMVEQKRVNVFLRPGLGKTPTTLSALLQLKPKRTLVIGPAQVIASEVWSSEGQKWAHLCGLSILEIKGTAEERLIKLMLGCDVEVISYENLIWLTDNVNRDRYDAVVYDEVDQMKHAGTKRFKRMRAWANAIPIRFGLTGSPQGNSFLDLWGEMYIVSGEKPLGPTFTEYQNTYFRQDGPHRWTLLNDGSKDVIRQRVKPYCFSISAKLAGEQLPEVLENPLLLPLPKHCLAREAQLRAELEAELDSGKTITALNASKLASVIRQFSSGAVYTENAEDAKGERKWEALHDVKLEAIENLISELQGAPLLTFVWFKHEVTRLLKRFPGSEILKGDAGMIERWNKGQIPLLLAHPMGAGRGLNLQYGGSDVCWYTQPWSRALFDQGNGRLARIGQKEKYVTAHLLMAGKIEKRVWLASQEKGADEAALIETVALL